MHGESFPISWDHGTFDSNPISPRFLGAHSGEKKLMLIGTMTNNWLLLQYDYVQRVYPQVEQVNNVTLHYSNGVVLFPFTPNEYKLYMPNYLLH